ncbi:hypothetical protein GE21DRAFT_1282165 [Neurospora crassa]|nr:hypothetical protein GE21DRAFT_1282165 [Neurospora crassa]
MAAGRCKEDGDRNWEYFNDVMDESEPINMMMGWKDEEETYWNWEGWVWWGEEGRAVCSRERGGGRER